jgi:hypothetical protein
MIVITNKNYFLLCFKLLIKNLEEKIELKTCKIKETSLKNTGHKAMKTKKVKKDLIFYIKRKK